MLTHNQLARLNFEAIGKRRKEPGHLVKTEDPVAWGMLVQSRHLVILGKGTKEMMREKNKTPQNE